MGVSPIGKIAIVTGGASGNGLAISQRRQLVLPDMTDAGWGRIVNSIPPGFIDTGRNT